MSSELEFVADSAAHAKVFLLTILFSSCFRPLRNPSFANSHRSGSTFLKPWTSEYREAIINIEIQIEELKRCCLNLGEEEKPT
jgi:hypothetical protein